MNFHVISLIIGLLIIVGTLISLRREHIRTEYSVSWLAVGVLLTALAAFPALLNGISARLEVSPEVFFLTTGGTLISILVFGIARVVSRLTDENVMLAQRVAVLEFQMWESADAATNLRTIPPRQTS
jgi:hypothetical protein